MKATAREQGGDFIINGTKHFISHADHSDFVILFAASGEEEGPRGRKKLITAFLVDMGTPGFKVRRGYQNVSHRGYTNSILEFNDCRVPKSRGARGGAPRFRGRQHLARRDAPAGRGQLPGSRRARARSSRRNGRSTACSSASRSASSRA